MTQTPGEPTPSETDTAETTAPPTAPWYRGRKGAAAAGAVVVLALVAGGAYAATSMLRGGDPAESALPDTALASLSLDLDPGAGQKVAALRTLRKFPDLRQQLDLGSGDDLREKLVTKLLDESGCDLTWRKDVEPWLGDNLAVAAVPSGSDVVPVVAVAVTDEDDARTGLGRLSRCGEGGDYVAYEVQDGFAVLSDTRAHVRAATARAAEHPLSDDATYQDWTGRAGDRGILNAYVAPRAASYLEKNGQGLLGGLAGGEITGAAYHEASSAADFQGGAATLRFADGGVELSAVFGGPGSSTGASVEDLVGALPKDTAAAVGIGVPDDLTDRIQPALDQLEQLTGTSAERLGASVGLDLPDDLATVLGSGVALAVQDTDADLASLEDPSALPVGLLVHGDPAEIKDVVSKVERSTGFDTRTLGLSLRDRGDLIAASFDDGWSRSLVAGTSDGLAQSARFREAVPRADRAQSFLYLDADSDLRTSLADLAGPDKQRVLADTEPLAALGLSSWSEKSEQHLLLKVTTD